MTDYGLAFFLVGEFPESHAIALHDLVLAVAISRAWSVSAPSFIDSTDIVDGHSFRTLGGYLPLAPPTIPFNSTIERHCYDEATYLIDALGEFSRQAMCEIEFELGGVFVGQLVNGKMDSCLSLGLLAEWKKRLESVD